MITSDLSTLTVRNPNRSGLQGFDIATAWVSSSCPHCGGSQALLVARSGNSTWLRCATCQWGAVSNDGTISPASVPMRTPLGLPPLDDAIWSEVRACLGVGAHAAAVMLCRKLLFHIAVENGLPAKNDRDRSPTFVESVDRLQEKGIITAKMRPWVDRIKDVGNDANHELTPVSAEDALDVATFTEQLLVLAYEMDALMADPTLGE